MKILQVITSLHTGGAEKLIVDMVPLYMKKGYQVDVLLFDGTDTPFKKQLIEKGISVFSLSQGGNVYNPWFIFKLIPYLKKYDIVHTHNTACQLFVAIASVLCSVVLVTTEHATSNRRRNWRWYKWIDRWMYSRYQSVICISDKTEENLCLQIERTDRIQTIYNGIDCKLYQNAKENLDWKKGKNIITMVAGFRYQKDQDTLIGALTYLPSNYYLWLIGDGERRSILEKLVQEKNLNDRVSFWGIRSDIPQILKSSDIIVMSSHWEGFGLAAVEGMAAGKPVIASNVPGLAQVVYGAGCLFPHGDMRILVDEIIHLMSNRNYYNQIAKRCLQRASQFDIQKTVDAYLEVYKGLEKNK